jgi:hypothetical protein
MAANHLEVSLDLNVFLDPGNSRRILIWTRNGAKTPFRDEHGAKPGFKLTVSADTLSADYDPANYNRFLRALHEAGVGLDVHPVPVHSRRLADRWGLIEQLVRAMRHQAGAAGTAAEAG